MALPRIIQGTWEELKAHEDEFRNLPNLTLIVPPDEENGDRYRPELTPEERIQRLDSLAKRNRRLPVLPASAFERESLYADDEE